jgi:hypothetical protein
LKAEVSLSALLFDLKAVLHTTFTHLAFFGSHYSIGFTMALSADGIQALPEKLALLFLFLLI